MTAVEVAALWKVKDAAAWLSVSDREVRRLAETGELSRRYVGQGSRFYRITGKSLDDYLASLSEEPA